MSIARTKKVDKTGHYAIGALFLSVASATGALIANNTTVRSALAVMAVAGMLVVITHVTRGMSDRLDKYDIPGGWRSLIGKD